jgi:hypothetical protein
MELQYIILIVIAGFFAFCAECIWERLIPDAAEFYDLRLLNARMADEGLL